MLPVGQTRYLIGLDFGGETAAVDLWVSAVRLFDVAGNWVLYRPTPDPTDDDEDWEAVRVRPFTLIWSDLLLRHGDGKSR